MGNENTLRLEGLPPGHYTLEVKAYNKSGMPSQNNLIYDITIQQVFYRSWWFYTLLSAAAVLIIYFYFRTRLQNIQRLQQLRTRIASNLHDEVGSLLTSITISTDSAKYTANTLEDKDERLDKIASLSRTATNTMSDVLWSIDARNDYAGNLTDRMREHAEAMLLPLGIDLEFDFTGTHQDQIVAPETRQHLYLIFKEAIHNIVKHSHATQVRVVYRQDKDQFRLVVFNNFPSDEVPSSRHKGQGLKNMAMRAKKIGAVLKQGNEPFQYTVIIEKN
jgi:signal transduction histidine kinase